MYGGVGRGKSMLMDLAFQMHRLSSPSAASISTNSWPRCTRACAPSGRRRRAIRSRRSRRAIADEAKLLCFDEMVINNSADAMILSRLFTQLLDAGVTVIATSNRPPARSLSGRPQPRAVPALHRVARGEAGRSSASNGPVDYRLERLGGMPTWHVPNGPEATAALREAFFRLTDYPPEDSANVPTEELAIPGGRTLHVPKSLKGVAVFSFRRLCGEPRGAADYLAIARHFHTVILVGIPMHGAGEPQRGGALRHPDRRALRAEGQAARRRRCGARRRSTPPATAPSSSRAPPRA